MENELQLGSPGRIKWTDGYLPSLISEDPVKVPSQSVILKSWSPGKMKAALCWSSCIPQSAKAGIAQPQHMERSRLLHFDKLQATQVQIPLFGYLHNIDTYTHKFNNTQQCVYSNWIPHKYSYQWKDIMAFLINICSRYFLTAQTFLRSTMTSVFQFQWYPPMQWLSPPTPLNMVTRHPIYHRCLRCSSNLWPGDFLLTYFSQLGWSQISPAWLPPSRNTEATSAVTPWTLVPLIPRGTCLLPYLSYIPKWTMRHMGKKIETHHLPGPRDTGSLAPLSALLIVRQQRNTAFPSTWEKSLSSSFHSSSLGSKCQRSLFHDWQRLLQNIALFPPHFHWL